MGAWVLLFLVSPTAAGTRRTVYLARHCVRSQFKPDLEYLSGKYVYLANYSNGGPLPTFGVAPALCTARGRRIIRAEGKTLATELTAGGKPPRVIYDGHATRDRTTAQDLLEGAGLEASLARPNASIFNPQHAGFCPYPSASQYVSAIESQLASVPPPSGLSDDLEALQAIIGRGVAPPIASLGSNISDKGYWLGSVYVASNWAETMLLQYGSGLPVGYGRVTPAQLYRFLRMHVYYRAVNDRGFIIEQRGQSNLLAHMLADLTDGGSGIQHPGVEHAATNEGMVEEEESSQTSIYVGHDTNLDGIAVLLNLTWSAPPYPRDATPPGSLLKLTRDGDGDDATITAEFLYATFEDESGDLKAATTRFLQGSSGATMPLAEFERRVKATLDWRCVRDHA